MSFWKRAGFLMCYSLPLLVIIGFVLGGWWNYLAVVYTFLLIPLLDQFIGEDTGNVPEADRQRLEESLYFRLITIAWALFQPVFLLICCLALTTSPWGFGALFGFVLGTSLVTGGIGITIAHELGHKQSKTERVLSRVVLMSVNYMHFYTEHNEGHHVWVATPEDPATAKRGQHFYQFWWQSVVHGYRHAWKICAKKMERRQLPVVHRSNPMIGYIVWQLLFMVAMTAGVYWLTGTGYWQVPLFLIAQSVIAFSLLELVNYVEHYGIVRRQLPSGQYERVNPLHSWNTSYLLSNFMLFQLQRHADHHYIASRRYQTLNHYDASPQLPYGYPTMILMALVPPLWFSTMNPRLQTWERARLEGGWKA